jgi:predicted DNA-binding transcriptional regulator YafY
LLKQYNDRWFVFGYRPDVGNYYYNVPLDRLLSKPEIIGQHDSCRPTDYLRHFENIIGVTKEANIKEKEILIKIKEINTWGRITTKPLKTQTIVSEFDRTNKFGIISLRVVPNHELFSRILSWGIHVEILSPKSIRDKFKGILQSMISGYDTSQ